MKYILIKKVPFIKQLPPLPFHPSGVPGDKATKYNYLSSVIHLTTTKGAVTEFISPILRPGDIVCFKRQNAQYEDKRSYCSSKSF